MSKKILALILALALVFALAACGAAKTETETEETPAATEEPAAEEEPAEEPAAEEPAAEEEPAEEAFDYTGMKAGIVVPLSTVPALQIICDTFVADLEANGMEGQYMAAEGDPTQYNTIIQNFVADGYDCVCVIPLDEVGLEDVVTSARAAGTKIVMMSVQPTYEVDGCLVTDYVQVADAMIQMVTAWVEENYADAEDGSIGVGIVASDTPSNYLEYKNTIISFVESTPVFGGHYDSPNETGGDIGRGYNYAQDALTADPSIRIFICLEVDSAKGIVNYLDSQGLDEGYAVFACNADEDAAALVNDGTVLRGLIPYGATSSEETGHIMSNLAMEVIASDEFVLLSDNVYTLNSFGFELAA